METTRTLDAINDSRQTEPGVYVWGKFTPDTEGTGFQDLPVLSAPKATDTMAVDNGGATLCQCELSTIAALRTGDIATSTATNFNALNGDVMYYFINSTVDVTQNAPENVTAGWFVQVFRSGNYIMQIAYRVDNPSRQYLRGYNGSVWSPWAFPFGSWFPGN